MNAEVGSSGLVLIDGNPVIGTGSELPRLRTEAREGSCIQREALVAA